MVRSAIRGTAFIFGMILLFVLIALWFGAWLSSPVISFIAKPTGKQDIYLADSRTGLIYNLTQAPGDVWSYIWSPDGKQLFYTMTDWDQPGDAMVIMDATGRNQRPIPNMITLLHFNLVWSPDGSRIAYFSSHPRNTSDLFIIDLSSGVIHNITPTDHISERVPSWSPDSKQIAFLRDGDIYRIDLETGDIQPLVITPQQIEAYPMWSPDGAFLAFLRYEEERAENGLYVRRFADETIQRVDAISIQPPSWSADGRKLVYSRPSQQVVFYDVQTDEVRIISDDGERGYDAVWSPDGTQAAYISRRAVISTHIESGNRSILSGELNALAPLRWLP